MFLDIAKVRLLYKPSLCRVTTRGRVCAEEARYQIIRLGQDVGEFDCCEKHLIKTIKHADRTYRPTAEDSERHKDYINL